MLALLGWAGPTLAQTDPDDRGYLQAFLEDNLSDVGREIKIIGFSGAFSSRASIDQITIADGEGIWLTLNDVILEWRRAGLLKGAIDISELSANEIILARRPVADNSLPAPEASGFSLPEIPVSIDIEQIKAQRFALGEQVIGEAAVLSLQGAAHLSGGTGSIEIAVKRVDGPRGAFRLDASYENASTLLDIAIALDEGENGIASNLIGLPGRPAIGLDIAGNGPLADFVADLELSTDNKTRLTGQLSLSDADDVSDDPERAKPKQFNARLAGDVAALFLPEYQDFFGDNVALVLSGRRAADGALDIDTLDLATTALSLSGDLALSSTGWPERFSLTGLIASGANKRTLLPLSGVKTFVQNAEVQVSYDAALADSWRADFKLDHLSRQDVSLEKATVTAAGSLTQSEGAAVGQIDGKVKFALQGLAPTSQDLAMALGDDLAASLSFDWRKNAPLNLSRITLSGSGYDLAGQLAVDDIATGITVTTIGDLTAEARDLSQFAGIAATPLAGSARVSLNGTANMLGGAFDLALTGEGNDLGIGQPRIDALFAGGSDLVLVAKRDKTATRLEQLTITTDHATGAVSGVLKSDASTGAFDVRINDSAALDPALSGPVTASGTAALLGDAILVDLSVEGAGGVTSTVNGTVKTDGTSASLKIDGTAPLALANRMIKPRLASGQAVFDVSLNGPLALASLSGTVQTVDARLALPTLRQSLDINSASATLSGGRAALTVASSVAAGGQITASGDVSLTTPYQADLQIAAAGVVLSDAKLFETQLDGSATVQGALEGGAMLRADLALGKTEIHIANVPSGAVPMMVGLQHINEPKNVRRTRDFAGLIAQTQTPTARPYPIDIVLRAPSQMFVRGRGLDAELGGTLRLTGTSADVHPQGQFNLIRGRLDILGKRLTLTEGKVSLQGGFDPFLQFATESNAEGTLVRIGVTGPASAPEVTFTSRPELPEDEVLALLLFGRDVTQISPLQALQLAAAVRTLAGKGGDGIVGRLRNSFALDDLDITTDETGAAQVKAGKYISENLYTDVTIGAEGNSEINLNLTISPSLTARGTVETDGSSSVGVFFERDY